MASENPFLAPPLGQQHHLRRRGTQLERNWAASVPSVGSRFVGRMAL